MITLDRVAARRSPMTLSDLSAQWGPGVHSIVGAPADGAALLFGLVCGASSPRSGQVRVLDGSPTDASVRRRVARIDFDPSLPEPLRVAEALSLAAKIRGDAGLEIGGRLAILGVETLAARFVRSLSLAEARAVCAAEALTSPGVRAIVVLEPLVAMDPRAARRIGDAMRSAARAGKCVLVASSSLRDAAELADDHALLQSGRIVARSSSIEALYGVSGQGVRLRVFARDDDGARTLAAGLAGIAELTSLERSGTSVRLRGASATALAEAVAHAAVASDVEVIEMRVEPIAAKQALAAEGGP